MEMEPTILGLQICSLVPCTDISLNNFTYGFPQFFGKEYGDHLVAECGDLIFRPAIIGQILPIYPRTKSS